MFLKKNIWLIYYALFILGLLYLSTSIYSTWSQIQQKTNDDLSYLNHVFSAAVGSNFDQQEIMLELLGQQLLKDKQYLFYGEATQTLDKLLLQNKSIVGFGLSNIEGQLIASSSNINLDKMPNLRTNKNSSESFLKTLEKQKMVLGTTYYLEALNNWIIPIRKAIHAQTKQVMGVMTAGINPTTLLPNLNELSSDNMSNLFRTMLVHDNNFKYAYISGITDPDTIKNIIINPIPRGIIDTHNTAMSEQLGLDMDDLRTGLKSAVYFAPNMAGEIQLYSLLFLPKYELWSLTLIPRSHLIDQLWTSGINYTLSFFAVFVILFLLFRHINEFEQRNRRQLIDQANHDFLTGLKNRLYLKHIEPEWIYPDSDNFSVLFIDLDNFKNINDSYGHTFGDDILKQVANRLVSLFSDENLICRQGGDEFILLDKRTDHHYLKNSARRILDEISKPYHVDQHQFSIGASIGICRYPEDGVTFDALFSAADTAMYRAKSKRNNFYIFTRELREQTLKNAQIEQALHNALKNNEFHMVYQPQITYKGALYGVEALVRWVNPELGFIPPDKFISIAEDSGFIIELGHYIINQSIKDITEFSRLNEHINIQLSINISVRQFLEDGFEELLKSVLSAHKFPSKQLTLEITESIFIEDFEYMKPLFQHIREMGIKFSLDDFGTGFSSLSMLRKLPIDELKIDKSFIDHITQNQQDRSMVLNIMDIAQNMGLKVVAEGIEHKEQTDLLSEYHCDIQQGYYYSKPVKFDELLEYISNYQ